jgi:hypothetical protein
MAATDRSKSLFGSDFVSDTSFSVSSRSAEKTVFVDLDDKPIKAKVVRGGKQVPGVVPDNARIDEFLSGVPIRQPKLAPRVVAQGIAPGIKVAPGTTINVVLTQRGSVPLGIFDDIHVAVRETSVEDMLGRVEPSKVLQDLVLKYDNADAVTDEDKVIMIGLLGSVADLQIDDTVPESNFNSGFNAVQAALAFK